MIIALLLVAQSYLKSSNVDLPDVYRKREVQKKEATGDFYAKVFMKLIRVYQQSFSEVQGDVCNFVPSCSHFGYQALSEFGFIKGLLLTSDRLQRCHPFAWRYVDSYGIAEDSVRGERLYDPPMRYK